MKRKIIKIDEEKCDGCGNCIPNCPEGALQMIDGKARLVSDLFCDGLGACMGECPRGAISIEEREAEPYDEKRVMDTIAPQGPNVIKAHLKHLLEHGENEYFQEALEYLREKDIYVPDMFKLAKSAVCGGTCPSTISREVKAEGAQEKTEGASELTHWPVQLHLISPNAPFFKDADLLVAADCVPFSTPNFHSRFLKGKKLIIACPKLDSGQEEYLEKLKALIDDAKVNTITVMKMEVPCCSGILSLVQKAASMSERKVPIKQMTIGIKGDVLSENWV